MIKKTVVGIALALTSLTASASVERPETPDLVIGLVIDQLRYDYVQRYWDDLGEGGFRRLYSEGYQFNGMHHEHWPTDTAPGHATIFTGAYPSVHGVVANSWWNNDTGSVMDAAQDSDVETVGGKKDSRGEYSPKNLGVSTLSDELRLFTNMKSRVVGISMKERSSIYAAGYLGNASYWFDREEGQWISSSYYMDELPGWLEKHNNYTRKKAREYMAGTWSLLPKTLETSGPEAGNSQFNHPLPGQQPAPAAPHSMSIINKAMMENAPHNRFDMLRSTYYGDHLTLDVATAAVKGEQLGQGEATDILNISLSAFDGSGHQFGPQALEMKDLLIRLDRRLEQFLNELDDSVGLDDTLIYLVADHGANYNPMYLQSLGYNVNYFSREQSQAELEAHLNEKFGKIDWFTWYRFGNVYLNRKAIAKKGWDLREVRQAVADFAYTWPLVSEVYTADQLRSQDYTHGQRLRIQNGYNAKSSPDVLFTFKPGSMERGVYGGTDHGTAWAYDTNIPMVWFGWDIKPGINYDRFSSTQIAPTLAALLKITPPAGSFDSPLPLRKLTKDL